MDYCTKLLRLGEIRKRMQDDESKYIFDSRIDFFIDRDVDKFVDKMYSLRDAYRCDEVEHKLSMVNARGIILFGCGKDGIKTKKVLNDSGYTVQFFCDSALEKIGDIVDGIEVISIEEVVEKYKEYLVVLSSRKYYGEMWIMLLEKGFPADMIMKPRLGIIYGACGCQYFDVFDARENEVFIDGGCWNGDTIDEFIKYANGKYQKVIAFEPLEEMYRLIQERTVRENWTNVEVINGALWNKEEELKFAERTTGSRVADTGERNVHGISIDSVVKDENVTFIKLDVEGAEMEALGGGVKTIQRSKPILAVSVYHKPIDIIEIPLFIIDLIPDCRFVLRHYSSEYEETVLYVKFN